MADKGKAIVSSPDDSPIKEAAGLTERERSRSPPAHLRPAAAADATATTETPTATTETPAATTDPAVVTEEPALSDVPPPPAVVEAATEEPALPQPPIVVQYRCVVCHVNFPSDHSLRGHMHVHTRPPRDSSAGEAWDAIVEAHEGDPPAALVAMMKPQLEHEAKKKGTTTAALVPGRYGFSLVTGLPVAGGVGVETGEGSAAQPAPLAAADVPPPPTEKGDTVPTLPTPVVEDSGAPLPPPVAAGDSIAPPPVVVAATAPPTVVADKAVPPQSVVVAATGPPPVGVAATTPPPPVADVTIDAPPPAPPAPVEATEDEKAVVSVEGGDEGKADDETAEEAAGTSGAAIPKLLDLNLNLPPKEQ